MATYPTGLPAPLVDGYALSPVDPVVRTEMEAGAARTRRRTRARNDQLEMSFVFSAAEFGQFRDWFDADDGASGGAAWFGIDLDVRGVVEPMEARFRGVWNAQRSGGNWTVTAKMEVRDAG